MKNNSINNIFVKNISLFSYLLYFIKCKENVTILKIDVIKDFNEQINRKNFYT